MAMGFMVRGWGLRSTGQKWRVAPGVNHTTLVVDAPGRPQVPPRWYGATIRHGQGLRHQYGPSMRLALFSLLFIPNAANAANLLVAPGGSGTVYPTINAAIAAAAPNDRIIIAPAVYNESLSINKSLELASNSGSERFTVSGTVGFSSTSANTRITIIGMNAQGLVSATSSAGAGSVFTLAGCRTADIEVLNGQGRTVLEKDSIFGNVMIDRGDVIGCVVTGKPGALGIYVSGDFQPPMVNRVIGNDVGSAMTSTSFSPIAIWADAPFVCENNLLRLNMPTSNAFPLIILNQLTSTTVTCTIRNNTFLCPNLTGIYLIKVEETDPTFSLDIRNNLFVGPGLVDPIWVLPGSNTTEGYNILTTTLSSVQLTNGAPTAGSPAINAGDPGVEFTDLDLSRNDAGCYGGSFSRDNFDDPLPTTAIVGIVNAPRRTQAALSVPITADGFDR
ncbi:MAG: hypothetical protein IPM68_15095 [Flavobacteriales bacterium]|nr:hypothetical protein [Flavobacteriales bacterium]